MAAVSRNRRRIVVRRHQGGDGVGADALCLGFLAELLLPRLEAGAVLPHCAALASPAMDASAANAATMTVLKCPPLIIQDSFRADETLARRAVDRRCSRRLTYISRSVLFMSIMLKAETARGLMGHRTALGEARWRKSSGSCASCREAATVAPLSVASCPGFSRPAGAGRPAVSCSAPMASFVVNARLWILFGGSNPHSLGNEHQPFKLFQSKGSRFATLGRVFGKSFGRTRRAGKRSSRLRRIGYRRHRMSEALLPVLFGVRATGHARRPVAS